ncbi:Ribosomal RNA small subunit methyltransferase I [compost metagenome]
MDAPISSQRPASGTLYVCGTPIGNMGDASFRLVDTLREVDLIAAEDTRQTAKLLARHGLETKLMSYHAHNLAGRTPGIVRMLQEGSAIALVSDAGMPGISDPGWELIAEAIRAGIPVVPIPGPSAFVAGLVVSGLPTDRFVFEGFLPREGKARRRILKAIAHEPRTLVFYEAPHRLADTLTDMSALFGAERPAAVARELTKQHEEVRRGSLAELAQWAAEREVRGEIVLVVGGSPTPEEKPEGDWESTLRHLLDDGLSTQDAAKQVAKTHGIPRRQAYQRALELATSPLDE